MQIDVNDYANDAGRNEQSTAHLSAVSSLEQDKDLGGSFPEQNPSWGGNEAFSSNLTKSWKLSFKANIIIFLLYYQEIRAQRGKITYPRSHSIHTHAHLHRDQRRTRSIIVLLRQGPLLNLEPRDSKKAPAILLSLPPTLTHTVLGL